MNRDEFSDETHTEVRVLIQAGLDELGVRTEPTRVLELTKLVLLLAHWAQRINLTGHRNPAEMTRHLVLDAVALATALPELAQAKSLADLGSGAGFPGLPLAILHPELVVRLVDSRLKRNHFQRAARRELGLDNAHPILGRSDEIEPTLSDLVISQAMAQPREALELMAQWSKPGGLIVLPASESAVEPELPPETETLERRDYRVPISGTRRILWMTRRRTDS